MYKAKLKHYSMIGIFDWGIRYACFRHFTAGWWQTSNNVNVDLYRRWPGLFAAAIITSICCVPFETANRAFIGDKTFPEKLRHNYTSPINALVKIFNNNPFALFKNSFPSFTASMFQTFFTFGWYEFLMEILYPTYSSADASRNIVKGV